MASAFSHDDFAKALAQHDYRAEKGQTVRGKVSQHASDGAYVDFGGKSPGFLPLNEVGLNAAPDLATELPLGSEGDFLVISEQNAEGQVLLSQRQLQVQQAWEEIVEAEEGKKLLQMLVTGVNRGGVTGEVRGLRGFIPRSHLMEKENMDGLVGQIVEGHVLEVNQENNKLVLTQRQLLKASALSQIAKGVIREGRVVKLQPYGIFVDLDGVTGLLHITQISGARIGDLSSIFEYGQKIQVYVLDIDDFKGRISLSTRILEAYPGELIEKFAEMMEDAPNRLELVQSKLSKAEGEE
ncbi:MAG: S1 RNA-binding domain-containing protein [Cyanobacteriota bacterium]|jgi:small subunit ribosomal protein S1